MPTDTPMQLGMIGLGRMGANLVRRLMRDGHRCVAYDPNPDVVTALEAEVWRRGSVVSSWLVDLTAAAFAKSPDLGDFSGRVSDSGEGRWTVLAAVDEGVPTSVIAASLYERFESRDASAYTGKILSAMRSEFGGHPEKRA